MTDGHASADDDRDPNEVFPTDYVLCDNSAETHIEHEQHMQEVHGL